MQNPTPGLEIQNGIPVSTRFGDVYYSRDDGLAETAHVFLDGCDLPRAWTQWRRFTVAETGFGTGLNFLATWDLWRRHRPHGGVLHYLAVEGFPIRPSQLGMVLEPFPALAPLAAQLTQRYPHPVPGLHRLWFPHDRVSLTLAIGEAATILPRLSASVDAWFLDGFAPAKNPSMWHDAVFREVARLSAPAARLASFTAAGTVRRGLAAVGFDIVKRPGFGRKRECIAGRFAGSTDRSRDGGWAAAPAPIDAGRVAVIGGGVAGAAVVGALDRRGIEARWFDRHGRPGAEASGNPLGLMMARPMLGGDGASRISVAAFRFARALASSAGLDFGGNGVVELAVSDTDGQRFQALDAAGGLGEAGIQLIDAHDLAEIIGVALAQPAPPRQALWHRHGGWVRPRDWVEALAGALRPARADVDDPRVSDADAVIVTGGAASSALLDGIHLPLDPVRGQLTRLAETTASRRLRACVAYGGYLSPAIGGSHIAGATYDRGGIDARRWPIDVRTADHGRVLAGMPPALAALFADPPSVLGGRAALRAATPDRLPAAGPVAPVSGLAELYGHLRTDARAPTPQAPPYVANQFVLTGLGSRGLVTAPLMAELVVAQMLGEPWPVERELAAAVHPNRFAIRDLKRRRL
jgi:tRNA 5-methylaminomethyl-2-thiouridine biosynthesis bifunctional protein